MIHGSMTHDFSGRKIKQVKRRAVYTPPPSARNRDATNYRRDAEVHYASADIGSPTVCGAPEKKEYTGTLVKGIATMHKSNAVPIIDQEQATDIANMRRN